MRKEGARTTNKKRAELFILFYDPQVKICTLVGSWSKMLLRAFILLPVGRPSSFFPRKLKKEMVSDSNCQWSIDDVITTSRGSKVARLGTNGKQCVYTPKNYLRVPFEPGNFDKDFTAQRLNLVLECDDELQEEIANFDTWATQYIHEHSERLFKKKLTPQQVAAGYCSCLKPAPAGKSFNPTLKCKIDTEEGRNCIRCWDTDGANIAIPHSWRGLKIKPLLNYSHLWIMGQQFGVVLKILDCEIAHNDVVEVTPLVSPFIKEKCQELACN